MRGRRTAGNRGKAGGQEHRFMESYLAEMKSHRVTFVKVKGHSDNEYNNRCDELARKQPSYAANRWRHGFCKQETIIAWQL